MFKPSNIDLGEVGIELLPAWGESPPKIQMSQLVYLSNTLILTIQGVVTAPPQKPGDVIKNWQISFKPSTDGKAISDMENLLEPNSGYRDQLLGELGFENFPYVINRTFKDYVMKLKLKKSKEGHWTFVSDVDDFDPNQIRQNQKLTVVVKPQFYFDNERNKYGLSYDVQEVLLEADKPQPATKSAPKRK